MRNALQMLKRNPWFRGYKVSVSISKDSIQSPAATTPSGPQPVPAPPIAPAFAAAPKPPTMVSQGVQCEAAVPPPSMVSHHCGKGAMLQVAPPTPSPSPGFATLPPTEAARSPTASPAESEEPPTVLLDQTKSKEELEQELAQAKEELVEIKQELGE